MIDGVELPQYPGYKIFRDGRIEISEIAIRIDTSGRGYSTVNLWTVNGVKSVSVHRLVAAAYCGLNIEDPLFQVDHKDEIKTNNVWTNLEVVTNQENCLRARRYVYSQDTDVSKRCRICQNVLLLSYFNINKCTKDGYHYYCRACDIERQRNGKLKRKS